MAVKYFSMFSGIGGFELAIERAARFTGNQVHCVGYSEVDRHAIATYEEHYAHRPFGDVTQIDPAEVPPHNLLVGGFPCQAFSTAGRGEGFGDPRGTLIFDVARVAEHHRPRHVFLENVRGLVGHDGGRTFRTILALFGDLGYCMEWQVLNSADFGVPQARYRTYLVGHLGGVPSRPVFPFAGQGGSHSLVGVTAETAVARTLTAGGKSGGQHSGMTILRTPDGDRRLTPVEWERLQGFPDGWTAGRSDLQRYRLLGQSVTVPVLETIVTRLFISCPASHP